MEGYGCITVFSRRVRRGAENAEGYVEGLRWMEGYGCITVFSRRVGRGAENAEGYVEGFVVDGGVWLYNGFFTQSSQRSRERRGLCGGFCGG